MSMNGRSSSSSRRKEPRTCSEGMANFHDSRRRSPARRDKRESSTSNESRSSSGERHRSSIRKRRKDGDERRRKKKKYSSSSSKSESQSSSSSEERNRSSSKKRKRKDRRKRKVKKKKGCPSSSSESESSLDDRDRSSSRHRKKSKHKKEKLKKKRKKRKKEKKKEVTKQKSNPTVIVHEQDNVCLQNAGAAVVIGPKGPVSNDMPDEARETAPPKRRAMVPMTKEEYEKQQSRIRRVFDPETGRNRLIKGDGEVLEEIVSMERHKAINKAATQGDGAFFQTSLGLLKR